MKRYRPLLLYVRHHWWRLALVVLITIGSGIISALQPWPLMILADNALGSAPPPAFVESLLAAFSLDPDAMTLIALAAVMTVLLVLALNAVSAAITWIYTVASQRIMYEMAGDVFRRLQRRSILVHNRSPLGDSLSRLGVDTRTLCLNLPVFLSPLQLLIRLSLIIAVAWQLDSVSTIALLSVAPPLALITQIFGRQIRRRAMRGREAQANVMSFVHQTLEGIAVIQSFGAERLNTARMRKVSDEAVRTVRQSAAMHSVFLVVGNSSTVAATAVVMYVAAVRVDSGAITIGALLVFFTYAKVVQFGITRLLMSYGMLKEAAASADRVLEVLQEEEGVKDAADARPLPAHPRGHVRLEAVTFGYEADRAVLHDVSLEARPGELVALVGHTGAGKSTLVSLIPRFFDPWAGRVTIDGIDVRDVTLASLRSEVSLVLQEPVLLPLSVADNIAYGRPQARREEIVAAAVAARADEFIRRLPHGYDTVIDERGAGLSVGERQRLTIARALLKDAPVLILDEPTSALDAETEVRLLAAVERLTAGRTTFVIAHRLSTVRRADRIVVLDCGRLVESGTHEALVAAGGAYHRMHLLQFGAAAASSTAPSVEPIAVGGDGAGRKGQPSLVPPWKSGMRPKEAMLAWKRAAGVRERGDN